MNKIKALENLLCFYLIENHCVWTLINQRQDGWWRSIFIDSSGCDHRIWKVASWNVRVVNDKTPQIKGENRCVFLHLKIMWRVKKMTLMERQKTCNVYLLVALVTELLCLHPGYFFTLYGESAVALNGSDVILWIEFAGFTWRKRTCGFYLFHYFFMAAIPTDSDQNA